MTEITFSGYTDYKKAVDEAFITAAEDYVRIGYLLRLAKENPGILGGTYSDYKEFARCEYGLGDSQVSRFVAINEKYGEGDHLLPQYRAYGQSKLAEMLTLPDKIAEAIPPEATREEIRELKKELKEDENTTPIELMLEGKGEGTKWQQAIKAYFEKQNKMFEKAWRIESAIADGDIGEIKSFFAPSGTGFERIRLKGIGGVMISFFSENVTLTEVLSQHQDSILWAQFRQELSDFFRDIGKPSIQTWEALYGRPWPDKASESATKPINPLAEGHFDPKNEKKEKSAPQNADKAHKSSGGEAVGTPQKTPSEEVEKVTGEVVDTPNKCENTPSESPENRINPQCETDFDPGKQNETENDTQNADKADKSTGGEAFSEGKNEGVEKKAAGDLTEDEKLMRQAMEFREDIKAQIMEKADAIKRATESMTFGRVKQMALDLEEAAQRAFDNESVIMQLMSKGVNTDV